jgi:hypothetical protein
MMSNQLCFSFPSVPEPVPEPDSATPAPPLSSNVVPFSHQELARRLIQVLNQSRSDGRRPGRRNVKMMHVSEIGSDEDSDMEKAA